jgi:hypothetical protein
MNRRERLEGEHASPGFACARRLVHEEVLPPVDPRDAYRRRMRLAFGLWLDYDWRPRGLGWHPDEPGRNYFTPQVLTEALGAALASGGPVRLALRRERALVGLYDPPGQRAPRVRRGSREDRRVCTGG